ncbi:MAG: hypothetical protein F6K40_09000 [Okeania sp. SIO3I5]|uniref:hypothetical protein n=1 Tax=Okeania sp. SIO3I5 TaxID=2607805 RepID=UPI0013B5F241|nr:hypothetical protein [Okeania sp. SIO3I5]NEQ36401.1 hypothetical protein [Okeania sp. SIO3I5]
MVLSPENLRLSNQQKFSELAEKQLENSNKDGKNFGLNLQDVIRQSKVVSQIVAFIWYYSDETDPLNEVDAATWNQRHQQAIKGIKWYKKPASTEGSPNGKPNLQNLLTIGDPRKESERNEYDDFLYTIFEDRLDDEEFYKFPIYDLGGEGDPTTVFEVDYKAFEGVMSDLRVRTGSLQLLMTLSFPPRPQYGKATVEAWELKEWYLDKDSSNRTPPSPYIPLCTT